MMEQTGLCMDKMGNMGRADRRMNRDRIVVDRNTEKWWNNNRDVRVGTGYLGVDR